MAVTQPSSRMRVRHAVAVTLNRAMEQRDLQQGWRRMRWRLRGAWQWPTFLALTVADGVVGVLSSPWLAVTVLASIVAFYASARGLQDGEAVPVIAATSTTANVSCILGGIIVFGDPMPSDTVGICVQAFAFVLVVAAALVTPPPVRAAAANAHA
jgi:hypothetical protein